jgi:hypothetical protein
MATKIKINRAPVLTLWATIVAERMGYDHAEALTLAKAVTGLNAQSKGRRLGIYEASPEPGEDKHAGEKKQASKAAPETITLLGRAVPVKRTKDGVRAMIKDEPVNAESVERYLKSKFGESLTDVQQAMRALAKAYPPKQLASKAYELYEAFRPEIPEGVKGWGAAGELDLGRLRKLTDGAGKVG